MPTADLVIRYHHLQANMKHPYYRMGYAAVVFLGLVGAGVAYFEDQPFHGLNPHHQGKDAAGASSSKST